MDDSLLLQHHKFISTCIVATQEEISQKPTTDHGTTAGP